MRARHIPLVLLFRYAIFLEAFANVRFNPFHSSEQLSMKLMPKVVSAVARCLLLSAHVQSHGPAVVIAVFIFDATFAFRFANVTFKIPDLCVESIVVINGRVMKLTEHDGGKVHRVNRW